MNIIHINNIDVPGGAFNGYELCKTMNEMGHDCRQLVLKKNSNGDYVKELSQTGENFIHFTLDSLEKKLAMQNILFPYSRKIQELEEFKNADIVHYHLLHNQLMSLYDLPDLFVKKPSVWTIHDPWVITGHCVYPMECEKWLTGCQDCPEVNRVIALSRDNASKMWNLKKRIFSQINPVIVVSTNWMRDLLAHSPLTAHWNKIQIVPFGINIPKQIHKKEAKHKISIPPEKIVLAFRCQFGGYKGVDYILKALEKLKLDNLAILTCDGGKLPEKIKNKYDCIEMRTFTTPKKKNLFYSASDIFLMPSIAESFGLMSIEAMSYGLPVICFKNTVLEEITSAPHCGVAVTYKNSFELSLAIARLATSPEERFTRGRDGIERVKKYYNYNDYVQRHIDIYQDILTPR